MGSRGVLCGVRVIEMLRRSDVYSFRLDKRVKYTASQVGISGEENNVDEVNAPTTLLRQSSLSIASR